MKKELDYFYIGDSYGGNQDWCDEFWMRLGGCAALTACDSSIYFSLYRGKSLYPLDKNHLTKEDYIKFSKIMKPYLRPRVTGVNRLSIYLDGFRRYLKDCGDETIKVDPWNGENLLAMTKEVVKRQIDNGFPIPYLLLKHRNKKFDEYVWHWFLINGYEEQGEKLLVKAVTYSAGEWLDFDELWDTQYEKKGGMILFREVIKE